MNDLGSWAASTIIYNTYNIKYKYKQFWKCCLTYDMLFDLCEGQIKRERYNNYAEWGKNL